MRNIKQLTLVIIMMTLAIALISCKSTQNVIEAKVPNPYDLEGNPLVIYNEETGKVEMTWDYYNDLVEYIIITEESKKLLN